MTLSNRAYDILKIVALILLPLSAFISTFFDIWGIPYGQQITATLVALDTLLGTLLKISSDNYHGDQNEVDG